MITKKHHHKVHDNDTLLKYETTDSMQRGLGVPAVPMDVVVVQLEGVDLKEEEVKQEFLVIKEVLVAGIEGVDYKVDKGLLVKEVVVASLFLDFKQKEKKDNNPSPQKKEPAASTTGEDTATPPTSPPCLPGRVGTGPPWQ